MPPRPSSARPPSAASTRSVRSPAKQSAKSSAKPPTKKSSAKKPPEKKPATKTVRPRVRRVSAPPPLLALIRSSLEDDKAESLVTYDLAGRAPFADSMVLATGQSNRHVMAMAEHLREKLEKAGRRLRIEGLDKGEWVLVDAGDVIIHLFRPEARALYQLEQLWSPEALGLSAAASSSSASPASSPDSPEA